MLGKIEEYSSVWSVWSWFFPTAIAAESVPNGQMILLVATFAVDQLV